MNEPLTTEQQIDRLRVRLMLLESWRRTPLHDAEILHIEKEIRRLTDR